MRLVVRTLGMGIGAVHATVVDTVMSPQTVLEIVRLLYRQGCTYFEDPNDGMVCVGILHIWFV
jgi:hypothetical protein